MIFIALNGDQRYVPISEIAEKLNISFHFLTKILQQFTKANLLASYRGSKGGVALSRPADQIYLLEIIEVMDGDSLESTCILGYNKCYKQNKCPLHDKIEPMKLKILEQIRTTTLLELASSTEDSNFELKLA